MAKKIVDAINMKRALTRMTYEIIEQNKGVDDIVLVGIQTRGVYLAKRIADRLKQLEKVDVPTVALDVSQYRDDVNHTSDIKVDKLPIDITNKHIILVDDVLFTGRTIRAAMDALIDQGRPKSISLAILIDRGHRELPIRPDFIGKNIPTSLSEKVDVFVEEVDGKDGVEIEAIS